MADRTVAELMPLRRADEPMPDGPVSLWIAVFDQAGGLLGAAPATGPLCWLWRNGALCLAYGRVAVTSLRAGRYDHGVICAVAEDAPAWRPMWRIGLGEPADLRAGDVVHVLDGVVAITPEGAPW